MSYEIRAILLSNCDIISQLDRHCFTEPWNSSQITLMREMAGCECFGGFISGELVSYLIAITIVPEAEILRIGTNIAFRNKGYAANLLSHALSIWKDKGVTSVWLEVRASNIAARSLYERMGFIQGRTRKGYYPLQPHVINSSREDAVEYSFSHQ